MIYGVDISHWQSGRPRTHPKRMDYSKLRDRDIKFVYIKVSEGLSGRDHVAKEHMAGVEPYVQARGVYHFYRTNGNPLTQALNFYNAAIAVGIGELRPAIDVEVMDIDPEHLRTMFDEVEELFGMLPVLYTAAVYINDMPDHKVTWLRKYPLWIASWLDYDAEDYNDIQKADAIIDDMKTKSPVLPRVLQGVRWWIWQQSPWMPGRVYGVNPIANEHIDLNMYPGTYTEFLEHVHTMPEDIETDDCDCGSYIDELKDCIIELKEQVSELKEQVEALKDIASNMVLDELQTSEVHIGTINIQHTHKLVGRGDRILVRKSPTIKSGVQVPTGTNVSVSNQDYMKIGMFTRVTLLWAGEVIEGWVNKSNLQRI